MTEKVLFIIFAALAVLGGIGTITRRNVVHALLLLVFTFLNIAVIFFLTQAYFLAVVQILVYAGAIMVLFVFVLMFLNLRTFEQEQQTHRSQRWIALVLSVLVLAEFVIILAGITFTSAQGGFTPEAIAAFCETIGVAKDNSIVDLPLLEMCCREHLNRVTPRVMAVLRPLKVVITNYPADQVEEFEAVNNPEDPAAGTRRVPFSRELWIERDDFMEDPPSKFYRLSPGREVRLRYAYFVRCEEVVKDAAGNVVELRCTYDPATRGGDNPPDGRKVKATIHWVSARHAVDAEVRLYDTLFTVRDPSAVAEGVDWKATLNPRSLESLPSAKVEPALAAAASPESRWQFERLGYFVADRRLSSPARPVFNRTVTLRDEWARLVKSGREAA